MQQPSPPPDDEIAPLLDDAYAREWFEEHRTQLRLQLGNVAANGGLAGVQNARRAQQAALVQRGQEGLHQAPVKGGFHGDSVPAAAGFEVFKSALQV